jgi:putative membrane protein
LEAHRTHAQPCAKVHLVDEAKAVESVAVVVAALLSAIHVLTLALGAGAIFARGRALARPLDEAGWTRLLTADTVWGLAAVLWIASGLGRVFFGGKEPAFYWRNGFFWIKLALFAAVFALELAPMITFIRVRRARSRGRVVPRFSIAASSHQCSRARAGRDDRVRRGIHGARRMAVLTDDPNLKREDRARTSDQDHIRELELRS